MVGFGSFSNKPLQCINVESPFRVLLDLESEAQGTSPGALRLGALIQKASGNNGSNEKTFIYPMIQGIIMGDFSYIRGI